MGGWPRNWAELTRDIGCEMCESGRPDANRCPGSPMILAQVSRSHYRRSSQRRWFQRHSFGPARTRSASCLIIVIRQQMCDACLPVDMRHMV
jgi:hypothetical protein